MGKPKNPGAVSLHAQYSPLTKRQEPNKLPIQKPVKTVPFPLARRHPARLTNFLCYAILSIDRMGPGSIGERLPIPGRCYRRPGTNF